MTMMTELQPTLLWQHFATLCRIPRTSKHEQALAAHLLEWARQRHWYAEQDAVGNILIRKPASFHMEDRVGVVLQGHLDMVAQQNTGGQHDFLNDPIQTVVDAGWVKAQGTTLGADNGMGVAAALAALEDDSVVHGPLEVLLTVDEEDGMSGARGLAKSWLQGRLLFNLDTESWGELCVGCAGGLEAVVTNPVQMMPIPADALLALQLDISGLRGGHSGMDIHLERANALRLLARLLYQLQQTVAFDLADLHGGSARNAIPREASATIVLAADQQSAAEACIAACKQRLAAEFAEVEPLLTVQQQLVDLPEQIVARADAERVIHLLLALPLGVRRWSQVVPGVVESSNNLGVASLAAGQFETVLLIRSLVESGLDELAGAIAAIARLAGSTVQLSGGYPGWRPDLNSRALKVVRQVFQRDFSANPVIQVIHAGLECGLIQSSQPGLEMVSFGPTIRNAHSPDEMVEVESVAQFWVLLKSALASVPVA